MEVKIKYVLIVIIFFSWACSERMPIRVDFVDWISSRYAEETYLIADEVKICRWERTAQNITRLAPEVDGLRVEVALFSTPANDPSLTDCEEPLVHYFIVATIR